MTNNSEGSTPMQVFPITFHADGDKWVKQPLVRWREGSMPRTEWRNGAIPKNTMGWGIDCGKSGIVVLDEDVPGAVERALGYVPETLTNGTGSGGCHYIFKAPVGVELKNAVGLWPGVDIRADGGYIVAPGSKRPDGKTYATIKDLPIAPLPPALLSALPRKAKAPEAGERREVGDPVAYASATLNTILGAAEDFGVEEGGRNDALNRMAVQAFAVAGNVLGDELVRERLSTWAEDQGLGAAEVAATLDSAAAAAHRVELVARDEADVSTDEAMGQAIAKELARLRVQRAARDLLAAEQRAGQGLKAPAGVGLGALLGQPDDAIAFRVAELWPAGGKCMIAAAAKAGKTTFVGNLIRSLVDGEPFLGQHPTAAVGRVAVIDNEMSTAMLRRWLRDLGIANTGAVTVFPARGLMPTFDVRDPHVRTEWAAKLRGADVLIVDCLNPVLSALGISENDPAVGEVTGGLDALCAEAGIPELVLVHHMGHQGERSRGHSSLIGWPDVTWKLVRDDADDDASARYFSAYGRDVDLPEAALEFEQATRHLTAVGGTRKQAGRDRRLGTLRQRITQALRDHPEGLTGAALSSAVEDKTPVYTAAREALISDGVVAISKRPGRGGGQVFRLVPDEEDELL